MIRSFPNGPFSMTGFTLLECFYCRRYPATARFRHFRITTGEEIDKSLSNLSHAFLNFYQLINGALLSTRCVSIFKFLHVALAIKFELLVLFQVGTIAKWSSITHEQKIIIKNTKDERILLTVNEHVPKTNDEKIKVCCANLTSPKKMMKEIIE